MYNARKHHPRARERARIPVLKTSRLMQLALIDINILGMRKNHSNLFSVNTRVVAMLPVFICLFLPSLYDT